MLIIEEGYQDFKATFMPKNICIIIVDNLTQDFKTI